MRRCALVCFAAAVSAWATIGFAEEPAAAPGAAEAPAALEWPREIDAPGGTIVIYQPQPETFKGDRLTGRAAVSVTPNGSTEPVFGAVWFGARVATDRHARTATILDMDITQVRFPGASAAQEEKLAGILKGRLPAVPLACPFDHLLAGIALAEREEAAVAALSTAPPKIIFSAVPAVLVILDGQPRLRPVEKGPLMRVVNTPFTILLDPGTKAYYLRGGDRWYAAADIMGPWAESVHTPEAIVAAVPGAAAAVSADSAAAPAPRIIVATKPTELIVTDGAPTWTPIEGNQLLYISNTGSDVFMEIGSQRCYLLLAGRWYRAASLDGPWAYVASDALPEVFAKIPYDSPKGGVLVHVAGTAQAREAVLDASIPQTTTVKPGPADLKVSYDGAPKFKGIEGTEMTYAVNTADAVIQVHKRYYCCRDAVWYTAKSPTGPWAVCTKVPKEIYTIPPSCPLYNVRYVNIYAATSEGVSVGYLPGYTGSYVYNNTVVYGTGYAYPPWSGAVYIPAPVTWGFHPVYNPWYGGWGYGWGPWHGESRGWVNWGDGHGGWWGPGGYHPVSWSAHDGRLTVNRKMYNVSGLRDGNIYRRNERPVHPDPRDRKAAPGGAKAAPGLANDLFADRNGDVFRKTGDGWERRGRDGWTKSFAAPAGASGGMPGEAVRGELTRTGERGSGRSSAPGVRGRDLSRPAADFNRGDPLRVGRGFDRSELDAHRYARQRGTDRAAEFNRHFSDFSRGGFERGFGGRGGGGFHGGGGHGRRR